MSVVLILILFNTCLSTEIAHASFFEYKDVEFVDLLWNFGEGEELIIRDSKSSGTGHYFESMRIYLNNYPDLELIFQMITYDRHFSSGIYPGQNIAFVMDILFSEMNDDGVCDILVNVKKNIYEGEDSDTLLKTDEWGQMRFVWDGKTYVLKGEMPKLLKERYDYEKKRWDEIRKNGQIIGDNIYFK